MQQGAVALHDPPAATQHTWSQPRPAQQPGPVAPHGKPSRRHSLPPPVPFDALPPLPPEPLPPEPFPAGPLPATPLPAGPLPPAPAFPLPPAPFAPPLLPPIPAVPPLAPFPFAPPLARPDEPKQSVARTATSPAQRFAVRRTATPVPPRE